MGIPETTEPDWELVAAGEETEEVSSDPEPAELMSAEDFQRRVEALQAMMEADPKTRDRMLAEIYVNIASIEMGIRSAVGMMQNLGPGAMMRGMFGRKNKE